MSNFKAKKIFGATVAAGLFAVSGAALADGAAGADAANAANKAAEEAAKKQIINLNANFNSFESSKDYENFIQSRSKLLKRNENDDLRDVDVNAQPADENSIFVKKFNFVSEEGIYFPVIAKIEREANKFVDQKFSARKIAALKNNLNNILIREGFTTSIIYINGENAFSQDNQTLTYTIKWGKVAAYLASDEVEKTTKNKLMLLTLPRFSQGVFQLSTLDQAIQDLTTNNKQVRIDVAPAPANNGSTNINIVPVRTPYPSVNLGLNNNNSADQPQFSASVNYGDLIGINDNWTASYTKRLVKGDGRNTDIFNLKYSQPIGFFNVDLSGSYVSFNNKVVKDAAKGVNNTYTVAAPNASGEVKVSYALTRDKTSVTTLYSSLSYANGDQKVTLFGDDGKAVPVTDTKNISTTLKVGANYLNNNLKGGRLYVDLNYSQGLGLFGGAYGADPDKVDAKKGGTAHSRIINLYASYAKNFIYKDTTIATDTSITGGTALNGRLLSPAFTFGGAYDIRGLRQWTISGDTGLALSTTAGPVYSLDNKYVKSVNPYLGLDFGVASLPNYDKNYVGETNHAASASLGVKVNGAAWRATLNLGLPFATSAKAVDGKSPVKAFQIYSSFNYSF